MAYSKAQDKFKTVKELNPFVVIEDRPDTVRSLTQNGYFVFYPTWTRYHIEINEDKAQGFNSWEDLYKMIMLLNKFS